MKSSLLLVIVLSIIILTTLTEVVNAQCGGLSSGKRIKRCHRVNNKNKSKVRRHKENTRVGRDTSEAAWLPSLDANF